MKVLRIPVADMLEHDGELLVLTDSTLLRLPELGARLLTACEEPRTVAELADLLEQIFGPPEEGSTLEATQTAVTALRGAGLLRDVEDEPVASSQPPGSAPDQAQEHGDG
ncbi:MAG: PqqD family peptide modification chaperone [Propionibacteriaceae bacterium]|nr:hypothetical protein [Propionibacteriaceae bacterium]HBY23427.1 hypothetical protein [Propionibacteriaceae bacterium]